MANMSHGREIKISDDVMTVLLVAQDLIFIYWLLVHLNEASCLVTSLHANVSLPLRWQQFSFWYANAPIGRVQILFCGSKSCFTIEEESVECPPLMVLTLSSGVSSGDAVAGSANEYEWPPSSAVSLSPEWKYQERDCGFAPSPLDWNPWVDIELHQQFPVLRGCRNEVLWLSSQLIFVLFLTS